VRQEPGRQIVHAYHVWVAGDWERPAQLHASAMRAAGLAPDYMLVGLIGPLAQRGRAAAWFRDQGLSPTLEFTEAESGFEQVTLSALRAWVRSGTADAAVLYAHAKGAYNISPVTEDHRAIMTGAVVGCWREAVILLDHYDAVGCFWEPGPDGGCFTGNFWWACRDYLTRLLEPDTSVRAMAEAWIGSGQPRAYNLRPDITYADIARAALGPPEPECRGTVIPSGVSFMPRC
jgi:hypothetical protein